jgi:hypothetical protein
MGEWCVCVCVCEDDCAQKPDHINTHKHTYTHTKGLHERYWQHSNARTSDDVSRDISTVLQEMRHDPQGVCVCVCVYVTSARCCRRCDTTRRACVCVCVCLRGVHIYIYIFACVCLCSVRVCIYKCECICVYMLLSCTFTQPSTKSASDASYLSGMSECATPSHPCSTAGFTVSVCICVCMHVYACVSICAQYIMCVYICVCMCDAFPPVFHRWFYGTVHIYVRVYVCVKCICVCEKCFHTCYM